MHLVHWSDMLLHLQICYQHQGASTANANGVDPQDFTCLLLPVFHTGIPVMLSRLLANEVVPPSAITCNEMMRFTYKVLHFWSMRPGLPICCSRKIASCSSFEVYLKCMQSWALEGQSPKRQMLHCA